MARLTEEQIKTELAEKGYTLIDASNYQTLNSDITIKCPKGHEIVTSLAFFRKPSFMCPMCDQNIDFINPNIVPQKTKDTKRIIAFDQATEKFGLSIFDNGELSYYRLFTFSGSTVNRLVKIRKFIQEIVIKEWQPDIIIMEDIQYQKNGILTFKVLAMLLGIIEEVCAENKIEYEVVSPNVWRKYIGTCGKDRKTEKTLSIAKVKEKYNVSVSDDVAEAILIGLYGVIIRRNSTAAFGKM